jgi:hypothetical protein
MNQKEFGPKCIKCGNSAEYYSNNKNEIEYRCKEHRVFMKGCRIYSRKSGFYYVYLGKGSNIGGNEARYWFQDVTGQEFSMTQKEIEKHGMVVID